MGPFKSFLGFQETSLLNLLEPLEGPMRSVGSLLESSDAFLGTPSSALSLARPNAISKMLLVKAYSISYRRLFMDHES